MPEKTIKSQRIFQGRLLQLDVLEVDLGGRRTGRREIVRHPGAVAVWLVAPDGRLVLVRQYRKALERHLLEVVAGTREPGESARACAIREVREETGYTVAAVTALGRIYTAPGFCNEAIDIYYARAAAAPAASRPDFDEKIAVRHVTMAQFAGMVARGTVRDAKTLAAWSLAQTRMQPQTGAVKGRPS